MTRRIGFPPPVAALLAVVVLAACGKPVASPVPPSRSTAAVSFPAGSTRAPAATASTAPAAVATPEPAIGGPAPAAPTGPTAAWWIARGLDRALDTERERLAIPGASVTILFPDGTSWSGTSGLADIAADRPVTDDTGFALASMSKTFVAALVLELSGEGAFGLEDRVARYLPELRLDPAITVRMLLDHTSGLSDYFLNPKIDRALQAEPGRGWSATRTLGYVGKPYFRPGTGWHYSNTNYLLLGMLAERVTGRSLAVEVRERFLAPLDLDETWTQVAEPPATPIAHGYRLSGPAAKPKLTDVTGGSTVLPFRSVVTAAGGAGGLAATSRDAAAWARALYGGDALSPESHALMLAGFDRTAGYRPRVPYGLGVQAVLLDGRQTYGHSGRFLGFRGVMRWLPEERVAIAVLTNQSRVDPNLIAARLIRIALPEPAPVPRPVAR
jgi:D-alanyl-D-alanine carboxypeptidase